MNRNESQSLAAFQRTRRAVLFAVLLVITAGLLVVGSSWEETGADDFIEVAGSVLISIAIIGRLWCTIYIGGRKSSELVEHGPYSISRNPLYVFSTIGAAGAGAWTASILVALIFGIGTALAFQIVIRREEKFLAEMFGQPYLRYCERVPRFFPNVALFHDLDAVTVNPRRLYRTFFDGLVFFFSIPAFELIEALQKAGVLPILLHLP